MDKMKIEYVRPAELRPYGNNPRKNDKAVPRMVESIREFGFRIPVLALRDGTVLDGHLRLKGALKMGLEEVPVIWADGMTDAQVKQFRILVNQSVSWADWDEEKLMAELAALAEMGADLSLTGFDSAEIDRLLAEARKVAGELEADPDDVPALSGDDAEALVRPGDVWELGEHRLCCGDSTSTDDMAALMADVSADLWLTDPPYNVAYEGKTKDALTIENDAMDDGRFREFLVSACVVANEVMKPGATFYIWHADSEGYNFRGACRDAGWLVRQCLVWVKQHFVMGRQDYQWKHEPCLYGWKGGASHTWHSDRSQTTVLEFDRPARNPDHPTMKPVELFEYLIQNSTKHGDVVLDSFGGSGTTVIACERTGRRARVMELDPRYAAVIVRRWEQFTGREAVLLTRLDE
ncbi:MAG: DNA modification methylase [Mailhella sp.]|nr:DNA modification methylase [Mailhella sp.]